MTKQMTCVGGEIITLAPFNGWMGPADGVLEVTRQEEENIMTKCPGKRVPFAHAGPDDEMNPNGWACLYPRDPILAWVSAKYDTLITELQWIHGYNHHEAVYHILLGLEGA